MTVIALAAALILSITLAVTIGPVEIQPTTVWRIVGTRVLGWESGEWSRAHEQIVWMIRLPRVLLGGIVGASLAAVGVAMQAMVRNPIADPYILGVSSGAAVGAVLVILFGLGTAFGIYALSLAAFASGLISFALVFALAQRGGQITPLRLILVGVAVSHVLSAITSFLVFRSPRQEGIQTALFWMMGSLAGAKWAYLAVPATVLLLGTAVLVLQARAMNALVAGEETAVTLGVDTNRFRVLLMTVAALLTGTVVAVAGAIGFVGLIMPHIVRLFAGSDHRKVLPISVLSGAIFLIWVDVLARTVAAPQELPIGIITSFLGGPFFLWLLHHKHRAFEGAQR
ncbi:MAG TPA: iron ABC transporter permease [Chloroflexota bacterium]|nr:iron ABC transporter permease [Chloroflexota bacterium]